MCFSGWIKLTVSAEKQSLDSVAQEETAIAEKSIAIDLATTTGTGLDCADHWKYPDSFAQRLRCAIFENLHSQG